MCYYLIQIGLLKKIFKMKIGKICILCIRELLYYAFVAGIMIYGFNIAYNINENKNIKKGYENSYYNLLNSLPKCKYKEELKEIKSIDISSIKYSIKEDKLCRS